jgi:myo-inositol 2-dehydrogenase/D-chiro-inositol 1-dehydrogenase
VSGQRREPAAGAPLGFGVIGAGRIGSLHARNLAGSIAGARLVGVMDADAAAAQAAAGAGAWATTDAARVLADPQVDAVLIASPTPLHAGQIEEAARAGKAIFCEKPVALDLHETIRAMNAVEAAGVPFQIGFNRRFDPGYAALAREIHSGAIGSVELFRSQSSDPEPPPVAYARASGGIYLDSVIHDIDTARSLVGEITRVTALGRVLVEPGLQELRDVDTSILTLEFASGALGVIMNSRRTVHGYDLRVEVHGQAGKLVTEDERATGIWRYGKDGIRGDYHHYFLDRFRDAYRLELQAFVTDVRAGRQPEPGTRDAVESLRVAVAATRSLHEARPVEVSEIA